MDNFSDFFWTVVGSTVGTTALLAAAANLFRTQLTHWLTRDLEALKAKHQQDLEAYKVGLIAQAEQAKSLQAVKTAKAMRIAELQFAALDNLQKVLMPYASRASAFIRTNSADREADFAVLNAALRSGTDAIRHAGLFLAEDDIAALYDLQACYSAAIGASFKAKRALTDVEADSVEEPLFAAQRLTNAILRERIKAMLEMS